MGCCRVSREIQIGPNCLEGPHWDKWQQWTRVENEHKQECWQGNWKHGTEWRRSDWKSLIWLADVWWSEGLDVAYILPPSFFWYLLTCLIICAYSVFKWEDRAEKQHSKYIVLFIWKLKIVLQMQYIYGNIMCWSDQSHTGFVDFAVFKISNKHFFLLPSCSISLVIKA